VTKQIAAEPSGALRYLLGLVHLDRRETALAEGALLGDRAGSQLADAYVRLSNLYVSAGRDDGPWPN
jgi:hypothetical protein